MNTSPRKTWLISRVGWMRSSGVNTLPGKIVKTSSLWNHRPNPGGRFELDTEKRPPELIFNLWT